MIRCARLEDIADITQMVAEYHRDVRPDLSLHLGTVAATVRMLIREPKGFAWVVGDEAPFGVLLAHVGASLWWPDPSAEVALWWVSPEYRGSRAASDLMTEFEQWAARSGAARIGATYTGKSAHAYFARRGYRQADTRMMKDLT
jgi:N-acetylglutamate synthase-like GNAT family acetyltransferase